MNVTETLMRKVMTRYEVDPSFLSVLFSFGETPHLAESGSSNVASVENRDRTKIKKKNSRLEALCMYADEPTRNLVPVSIR